MVLTQTAALAGAVGTPDLGNAGYIPTIYSKKHNLYLYENLVIAGISNTDYQGDIANQGDSVIVPELPDITIFDYHPQTGLPLQAPSPSSTTLLIDHAKGFNYAINAVQEKQSHVNFADWNNHAVNMLARSIDAVPLQDIYTDAGTGNAGTTAGVNSGAFNLGDTTHAVAVDKDNAHKLVTMMGAVLDEQKWGDKDRWLVAPPWFFQLLKISPIGDAAVTGDASSPLRHGAIGEVDRFRLHRSNELMTASGTNGTASVTGTYILFGTKQALTFATQLTISEVLKNPNDFGNIHRGLQVFGYKVMKSEGIGCAFCYYNG